MEEIVVTHENWKKPLANKTNKGSVVFQDIGYWTKDNRFLFFLAPFCLSLAFSFYLFITFTLFSSLQVLFYSEPCIYSNLASCSDPFTYYKITMIFRWYVGRQRLLNGAAGRALVPTCVSFRLLNAGVTQHYPPAPSWRNPFKLIPGGVYAHSNHDDKIPFTSDFLWKIKWNKNKNCESIGNLNDDTIKETCKPSVSLP